MPGIDGWETLRRLRRLEHVDAKVAIVSANAFDKGLDNDGGIRPEDFILKPVRHSELLDWLERQLGLRWLEEAPASGPPAPAPAVAAVRPRAELLVPLQQAVQLGYYRGILNQLEAIDTAQPECAAFTAPLRELARRFQFEAIGRALVQEAGAAMEGTAK
jgi:CheY-like chemotaxis protein